MSRRLNNSKPLKLENSVRGASGPAGPRHPTSAPGSPSRLRSSVAQGRDPKADRQQAVKTAERGQGSGVLTEQEQALASAVQQQLEGQAARPRSWAAFTDRLWVANPVISNWQGLR